MATRTLEVVFLGNAAPLQAAMGKVEGSAGQLHAKVEGLSSKFGGLAAVAGGVFLGGALSKAPGFLMDAAKAAAEDEQSTARLSATIKSLGGDYESQMAKVQAAIAAGQKLAFSDDEVRDSFDKLAQATGNSDEALKRQKLAMDLARGANIPLADASKLLGKVTDENLQVFKKMGITLPDVASEADVLAAVQGKFAGQSEAYAKSTAGQFEILKIKMSEAKETIGAALLPIMVKVGEVLSTVVVPAIETFAGMVGPAFGAIGEILGTLQPLFLPMAAGIAAVAAVIIGSMIPAGIAWVAVEWAKVTAFLASAAAFLLANAPLIAIALAIGLLVAGVVLLIQHWDDITAKFPILGDAVDAVKVKLGEFTGWVTGTFTPAVMGIYTGVKDAIEKAVKFVNDNWDKIGPIFEAPLKVMLAAVQLNFDLIQTAIETVIGVIKGILDVFMGVFTGDWDRAWKGVKTIFEGVWNGITGVLGGFGTFLMATVPAVLDAGKAIGGAVIDGIKAGISGLMNLGQDLGRIFANAVADIINSQIIDRFNRAVEFEIELPFGKSFKVNPPDIPHIPHMATGGIVTRPTLALIGEAGPEAVIPLSRGRLGVSGGQPQIINLVVDGQVLASIVNTQNARGY